MLHQPSNWSLAFSRPCRDSLSMQRPQRFSSQKVVLKVVGCFPTGSHEAWPLTSPPCSSHMAFCFLVHTVLLPTLPTCTSDPQLTARACELLCSHPFLLGAPFVCHFSHEHERLMSSPPTQTLSRIRAEPISLAHWYIPASFPMPAHSRCSICAC